MCRSSSRSHISLVIESIPEPENFDGFAGQSQPPSSTQARVVRQWIDEKEESDEEDDDEDDYGDEDDEYISVDDDDFLLDISGMSDDEIEFYAEAIKLRRKIRKALCNGMVRKVSSAGASRDTYLCLLVDGERLTLSSRPV